MVYSRDELGRLTESFNEMTALITAQRGEIAQYALDLEEAYISTVRVLAAAIDARDSYTLGHSTRVSRLSTLIGREIGLTMKELEELEMACLFHDVGKIKTPDAILRKDVCLNEAEQMEMMRHTEYGAQILSKAPSLHRFISPVRHHHEWFNGQGYPDGLSGEGIPLFAAIISVADSFDAMTSDRPYRRALSQEEAKRELLSFSGRQFNPVLIDAFMKVLEDQSTRSLSHLIAA
jgi:putative nucleotidyltransferase with HDIG domain